MENLLSKIRESINEDYLIENWHEYKGQLCTTIDGYISMKYDCVCIYDDWYHLELNRDSLAYDDINHDYILEDEAIQAYSRNGNTVTTLENECIYYDGNYYVTRYLSDNNIVQLYNGEYCDLDNCYYHESDGEYYLEPEEDEEEEEEDNSLFGYDSGPKEKYYVNEDAQEGNPNFGFGIEIEKSEMPNFSFNKHNLYDETGCVIERDGSVSNGFELKTAVYNLLSPKTDERILDLEKFCNVEGVNNAGGHIGFSMEGKTDTELLDLCAGWLPLIYSMYKKRLTNSFCTGKKNKDLKKDKEKFQSICLRGNYIEFRIFASVKNFSTLKFRLELFRIISKNLGKGFSSVIGTAINNKSELYKLLTGDVYSDGDKFERLIKDAIEINAQLGTRQLTEKRVNKISSKLAKLKNVAV